MPPNLSVVPDPDESEIADHLTSGDVVDVQTLESEAPFCGVTITRWTAKFLILTPDLPRASKIYSNFPLLVPWHAVAWIRLGTDPNSFTDPLNDPPNSDEYGHPLRDQFGNRINKSGDPLE